MWYFVTGVVAFISGIYVGALRRNARSTRQPTDGSRSDERAIVLPVWPSPNAGAPMPIVIGDDTTLFVRYYASDEQVVVVYFPLCKVYQFGSPNDEALGGHPLYGRGLDFYSVHRVENSSWIAELEQRNSVHPRHEKKRFLKDLNHYVFTFHDSTLECVVREGEHWRHCIKRFDNESDADRFIQQRREPNKSSD
jgi:hypothetical protein